MAIEHVFGGRTPELTPIQAKKFEAEWKLITKVKKDFNKSKKAAHRETEFLEKLDGMAYDIDCYLKFLNEKNKYLGQVDPKTGEWEPMYWEVYDIIRGFSYLTEEDLLHIDKYVDSDKGNEGEGNARRRLANLIRREDEMQEVLDHAESQIEDVCRKELGNGTLNSSGEVPGDSDATYRTIPRSYESRYLNRNHSVELYSVDGALISQEFSVDQVSDLSNTVKMSLPPYKDGREVFLDAEEWAITLKARDKPIPEDLNIFLQNCKYLDELEEHLHVIDVWLGNVGFDDFTCNKNSDMALREALMELNGSRSYLLQESEAFRVRAKKIKTAADKCYLEEMEGLRRAEVDFHHMKIEDAFKLRKDYPADSTEALTPEVVGIEARDPATEVKPLNPEDESKKKQKIDSYIKTLGGGEDCTYSSITILLGDKNKRVSQETARKFVRFFGIKYTSGSSKSFTFNSREVAEAHYKRRHGEA